MKRQIVVLDSGTFYGYPSFEETLADLGELFVYDFTEKKILKNGSIKPKL